MDPANPIDPVFDVSVGVMAYNEGQNIAYLLESLLSQKLEKAKIREIIVVSSECRDETDGIVKKFEKKDTRVKILSQSHREGKASAINLFLSKAKGDIFVIANADTIPETDAIERLVAPFTDAQIGMTGARPIPLNGHGTFEDYAASLMWSLHHKIAQERPKLGELVAFRNFVKSIPENSAVDEARIEAMVTQAGYELHYVPDAVVRNNGPDTIGDFIRQRRRIATGHRHLLKETGYKVSTLSPVKILKVLLQEHTWGPKETVWTIGIIGLEALSRFLGSWDLYVRKKNPYIWEVATSTKRLRD
jgi:cellulose synthase/poly-beta-1,6-N-acetylglucosamine synthase-like glycosyltransferase